ncbi:LAMI_0E03202g1_1 [Lachancea mirantina]|uniref:LAMI_0E03202g1_1 n=1 Tax=Lachancea mirantina TaxID=1230905 RepID=A0A1G4JJJ3_9SACH|nr:LAMI_0E03202g1_1 [Lachancea mirantina]
MSKELRNSCSTSDNEKPESLYAINENKVDRNRPETFLNSDDVEKVTESEIYPQKRLFSFLHTKKIPPIPTDEERGVYPLFRTNWLYRLFFWWVFPILRVGYKRTLQPNDLWKMDDRMSIETLSSDFTRYFDVYVEKTRARYRKKNPHATEEEVIDNAVLPKHTLVKVLLFTFKWQYFMAFAAMTLSNGASAFLPMVTKRLIDFVSDKTYNPELRVNAGVGYAIGSCVMMLINGVAFSHFLHNSQLTGVQVRTVLTKAILTKSMRLSGSSRHRFPNGKITSIMSTDLSRLERAVVYQPLLGSFFVAVAICVVLLIINLGPIALVGIGIFIVATCLSAYAFKRMISVRKKTNLFTDVRVTLMREVLNNMKMIKFYAWEDAYEISVHEQRSKEIVKTRSMQFTRNFVTALAVCLANIASMVTFLALYKVKNHGRTPANVFSSLSLFQVLSIQMFFIPMALSTAVDGYIALNRSQELLDAAEENCDIEKGFRPCDDKNLALKVVNCSFEWRNVKAEEVRPSAEGKPEGQNQEWKTKELSEPEEESAHIRNGTMSDTEDESFKGFHNLNFEIGKGELIIITGPIGTGKSSLLSALAGFMRKIEGDVFKSGSLLLCGYPWIQNATVRDNIIFGSPYDEAKFKEVIRVCSLQADLDMLPAHDKTEIGERGITLSGGQKARINLARSVYKSVDTYLFDDVLSAVDARVGKHIMDECMLGRLREKTIILATHQLSLIDRASRVIFLGTDGSFDIGTFTELKKRNTGFNKLMEFASKSSDKEKDELDSTQASGDDVSTAEELERFRDDERQREMVASRLKKELSKRSYESGGEDKEAAGRLMAREERAVNSIDFDVYKNYISAGIGNKGFVCLPFYLILLTVSTFSLLFSSVWLSFWTEDKFKRQAGFYIGMYVFFVFFNYFCTTGQFTLLCYLGLTASKMLNLKAVKRILHTSMSFIDTTPIGRVLNRFTKDTDTLDTDLTESVRLFLYQTANITGVVIMCIIYLPWFAIAVPFLIIIFALVANHYQSSSREIKRLEAIQRSHVFNNFNEVLSGIDTIRAYRGQDRFLMKNDYLTNKMNEAGYLVVAVQRWVSIAINMIAMAFALIVALLCVTRQFHISPSSVGVLLTYVLQLPGLLNTLMRAMTQGENDMNSAERMISYATALPLEANYRKPEMTPVEPWPSQGEIVFNDVSLAYRRGLPLVLKNVSIDIGGGEKVGICGRTGAGKSTIMTALYRICELHSGSITIDGVDISKIGLFDLRSKLSIIPQDPVLFKGSIRRNLDPFNERTDEQLWNALVRSGAVDASEIEEMKAESLGTSGAHANVNKFHLSQEVEDDGSNFSLGERQLLALARALVRQSKIIILDEATSSVDYETDAKIQTKIVQEFSSCTILCVAHRLNTILDYDRILVLEQGSVAEFDTPKALFRAGGIFTEMCQRSSITSADFK